jgi:hypothetical protein
LARRCLLSLQCSVSQLAEAFRELQSDRNQWNSSRAALAAVEQFLAGYRVYAEIAAKRFAGRVLSAHEEYETSMQEILAAEAECDRELAQLASLQTDIQRPDFGRAHASSGNRGISAECEFK